MAAKSFSTLANSSRFLWRAWLGTAVTSQETAVDFAQHMAKKGEETEQKARTRIGTQLNEARSRSNKLMDRARGRLDTLENKVGRSMSRSLHLVGVPTRSDVDRLALLMADMSESIEELTAMKEQQQQQSQTQSQSQSKAKRPSSSS